MERNNVKKEEQDVHVDCDVFPAIINDQVTKMQLVLAGSKQPKGPFPKDPLQQDRSFSPAYYTVSTKSGLKLTRLWLSYSRKLDSIFCLPCWLFPQLCVDSNYQSNQQLPFSTTGFRDWKHCSERIKTHEMSKRHIESCMVYQQWRKRETMDELLNENSETERNFWRKIIHRILDVTLTLVTCNLPFRGAGGCEKFEYSNKGNFLSIIELLSKYDDTLQDLIARPQNTTKYLSPQIQNELINLLASNVENILVCDLQNAPFFHLYSIPLKIFLKSTN